MTTAILVLALLLVAGTIGLWIFLERKFKEEEFVERVEPDLQDMFEEITVQKTQVDLKVDRSDNPPTAEIDVEYEERAYTGPVPDPFAEENEADDTTAGNAIDTTPTPLRRLTEEEPSNMFSKIKSLFKRNKDEEYTTHPDEHLEALVRPAAVRTVAFLLKAPEDQPYTIREILEVGAEQQLLVGEEGYLDYLTTTLYGDEPMYSVAHLLEPGSFREGGEIIRDLELEVPGILLFSQIPGPDPEISTIDSLIRAAAHFGNALGGTLYDETQRPVDREGLAAIREEIAELDKREWDRALNHY